MDPPSFTLTPTTAPATGLFWRVSQYAWTNPSLASAHAAGAPAAKDAERGFVFPVDKVSYDPATGATAVDFLGSLTLGDQGGYRITLANPSILVSETGAGSLLATVTYCISAAACAEPWMGPFRVTVAIFQAEGGALNDMGDRVSWTIVPSSAPQADPSRPTLGQFPQPFLNSLDPSLQEHFKEGTSDQATPSATNSQKAPAPISVSFAYGSTATGAEAPSAGGGSAAARTSGAGYLTWGVKESFRNYVVGRIARGAIAVSNGAVQNRDGTFQFSAAATSSPTSALFNGAVRFTGHDGELDMTISNVRILVTGSTGTLRADVASGSQTRQNVEFATLDLSRVTPSDVGGSLSWVNVPAALTTAGADAFGGNYRPGQALDPVSFTLRRTATQVATPMRSEGVEDK